MKERGVGTKESNITMVNLVADKKERITRRKCVEIYSQNGSSSWATQVSLQDGCNSVQYDFLFWWVTTPLGFSILKLQSCLI